MLTGWRGGERNQCREIHNPRVNEDYESSVAALSDRMLLGPPEPRVAYAHRGRGGGNHECEKTQNPRVKSAMDAHRGAGRGTWVVGGI